MSRFKNRPTAEDVRSLALGDIVATIANGIAEAQRSLDESSLQRLGRYYDLQKNRNDLLASLPLPNWYVFSETTAKVKFVLAEDIESKTQYGKVGYPINKKRPPLNLRAVFFDGEVANKYGFGVETCAEFEFVIKPVPVEEGHDEQQS